GRSLVSIDRTIASTVTQIGPATDLSQLGFEPPSEDSATLGQIRRDATRLSDVMRRIIAFDEAETPRKGQQLQHAQAEPLATNLGTLTLELVNRAQGETTSLIAENRSSFAASQHVFIAVAAGSIALALFLGFILAWSLIGPIQRLDARVAAIASGDFSEHVSIDNRDELGTLAENFNRMNDELARLYEELETVSKHKSDFLANTAHE